MGDHLQAGIESLDQVSDILSKIEAFGVHHGLPARAVFHLQLACDEMLTNIISYGFPDGRPPDIQISVWLKQDMIETNDDQGGSSRGVYRPRSRFPACMAGHKFKTSR